MRTTHSFTSGTRAIPTKTYRISEGDDFWNLPHVISTASPSLSQNVTPVYVDRIWALNLILHSPASSTRGENGLPEESIRLWARFLSESESLMTLTDLQAPPAPLSRLQVFTIRLIPGLLLCENTGESTLIHANPCRGARYFTLFLETTASCPDAFYDH